MGISNMQGTYGYIEYIGEKKIRKYSCRNCYNYGDGICKVKRVALNYSEYNRRGCSNFDSIEKHNIKSNTKKARKNRMIGSDDRINTSKVILSAQNSRSNTRNAWRTGKQFVMDRSIVQLKEVKSNKDSVIVQMFNKSIDKELFNRLLDKPLHSQVLYKGVIYEIIYISNSIKR